MSQEDVDLARAQYARWNSEDFDAWINGFDPDVQYLSSVSASLDGQGEFHGHEGMRRFVESYLEAWEWFRLQPVEFVDAGDQLAVVLTTSGRGRGSGAVVEGKVAHVWTFRNRRATQCLSYASREEALKAGGKIKFHKTKGVRPNRRRSSPR
jgi:ketosteroid isomerase-like protein